MNIAFITLGFIPLRTAGIDIVGERLIQGLLDENHHVTVIAGEPESRPEVLSHPELQIIRIPLDRTHWFGFGLRAARALQQLERERSFDIVHFWDIYFAWAYRGKFVASLHHSFKQRISTSLNVGLLKKVYYWLSMIFVERPAVRRASGLLAVSETTRDAYLQGYKIPTDKVVLTRNGIDTLFFQPVANTEQLRTSLNIPPGEPVLMYSGFFTPRKGLEYLAQAMLKLKPTPWLVLTGKWDQTFQEKFLNLLGQAREHVVIAGFVPDAQMPTYFSMADLYVSTSLLEGFGIPLAEALACGTPVVASDAGAVTEVMGPGGELVPAGDVDALASAVSALLLDPERRDELGKRGRNHILTEFNLDRMKAAYLEAYRKFQRKSVTP